MERGATSWQHPMARDASDPNTALDIVCQQLANSMQSVVRHPTAGALAHRREWGRASV